jgi:hypothetical protein
VRRIAFLIVLLSAVGGHSSAAFAWGCVAEAEDGASGWSNQYESRRDALKRALRECEAKTSEECEITDCNEDW